MEKDKETKTPARNASHSEAGGGKYIEAVGRRKTSTARVRIWESDKAGFFINGKEAKKYFKTEGENRLILDPMIKGLKTEQGKVSLKWKVEVHVSGGGIHSQSEAIRHGLARALVLFDGEFRKNLKNLGYLKRDPRAKERRKFGLKKARKAPQWSKR
ncbi:MAG: 30S ribosomal protein S9 [Parcubacteria group bacterium GW2011_GWB1_36_5]|nr:MAG: 30S ribosomal protein S9 [Parcubacteria group bacterium GW2011_GWA2_36_24]KKQ08141.1 MAG: 30S ribosomal protein S9 [Parcubacteria group bacterium GW2011_GWB1_36_5]